MKETTEILHNMSGASRSTAYVEPRRVEPPPIVAHGAKVRSDKPVLISPVTCRHLFEREDVMGANSDLFLRTLHKALLRGHNNSVSVDDDLRDLINTSVAEFGLIGCVLVQPYKGSRVENPKLLRDIRLTLVILSKSSDRLFVASKTPNLSIELLRRQIITFDNRIIELQEKLNENSTT